MTGKSGLKPLTILGRGTLRGRRLTGFHLRPEVLDSMKYIADGPQYLAAEFLLLLGIQKLLEVQQKGGEGTVVRADEISQMSAPAPVAPLV